ncbi:N-acetyltransferase [Leptospira langatensis]|uniref:N-acetyltransferase n=1 Tax=Leptospira langatensis TaxID=2484983 RepID=A0A5F1ZUF4_9LEPT|nr:GNAT family N-acetyltransferase [Leptospira langatensis]TGJ98824.1 N-acetyltransferase [Leptospira langatensis]TGL40609.1 N-acetyltransferase [Leptospira langatensis]
MSAVEHDTSAKKFFILEEGREAHLMYREIGAGIWDLYHTFVPSEFRGQGIASKLAEKALNEARKLGKKIIPNCSYVQTYLKRHPEFADLAIE